jgi:hypothetical protein
MDRICLHKQSIFQLARRPLPGWEPSSNDLHPDPFLAETVATTGLLILNKLEVTYHQSNNEKILRVTILEIVQVTLTFVLAAEHLVTTQPRPGYPVSRAGFVMD